MNIENTSSIENFGDIFIQSNGEINNGIIDIDQILIIMVKLQIMVHF